MKRFITTGNILPFFLRMQTGLEAEYIRECTCIIVQLVVGYLAVTCCGKLLHFENMKMCSLKSAKYSSNRKAFLSGILSSVWCLVMISIFIVFLVNISVWTSVMWTLVKWLKIVNWSDQVIYFADIIAKHSPSFSIKWTEMIIFLHFPHPATIPSATLEVSKRSNRIKLCKENLLDNIKRS